MKKLEQAYKRVIDAEATLACALETLSAIASKVYGEELHADLCGGVEVEFRRIIDGRIDDFGCIRLEDIMKAEEKTNKNYDS